MHTRSRTPRHRTLAAGILLALGACEIEPSGPRGARDAGSLVPETGTLCRDGIDNDGDGLIDCAQPSCDVVCAVDSGPRPDAGFQSCEGAAFRAEEATLPLDIVWIIDNSGSMNEEARIIQANLNHFVAAIEASGITNYRVVVITQAGFVSVPPPLGVDAERFLFVPYDVQSDDAMTHILASYPLWRDFLRRSAIMHIVHVTDDESSMTAEDFRREFTSMLGKTWVSHAIASPPGSSHMFAAFTLPGCTGPTGDASANGDRYWALAALTGGQQISICTADWSASFDVLLSSIAVPHPVPCELAIPAPPDGVEFDRGRVNVVYAPGGGGATETFPYAGTSDGIACPADGDGWYYDDPSNPTHIVLCPRTCARLDSDTSGEVRIELGCETILL